MVQPEQPQPQRLPLFFRLRTARTANTRIHAKIKMSSTVPIFFPFSESGNHRRMRPAPSTGSRASGLRSGFAAVLTTRCFAPLLRPAPPCGALRASGLRSGFAAVLTPRCFAPFVAARAIGISNHSVFHPCGALNLIAILQICRADLEISPVPAAGPAGTPAWPASTPAPSGRQ